MTEGRFVATGLTPSLLEVLRDEMEDSARVDVAVAFVGRGGINLMLRPFERHLKRGGEVRILTSLMGHFNDLEDLRRFAALLPGLDVRLYIQEGRSSDVDLVANPPAFHPKGFLFKRQKGRSSLLVGSANLTMGGLKSNVEWGYLSGPSRAPAGEADTDEFRRAAELFESYWREHSVGLTDPLLDVYTNARSAKQAWLRDSSVSTVAVGTAAPRPRPVQREALESLARRRADGVTRTTVIAATGIGKTYLTAFDFLQSDCRRVLFIAHRRTILEQARQVYRRVLADPTFGLLLDKDTSAADRARLGSATGVFAMIQTLSQGALLSRIEPEAFEYVVLDEFHHAEAVSYRRVLDFLRPRFLLGVTATPERMDGKDVLRFCDFDVAYEVRLFDAIDRGWLAPFQYFAIHDPTDYSQIHWARGSYDEAQLEQALSTDTRAALVVNNMRRYLPATGKSKALAFCASKSHARFMSIQMDRLGIPSKVVLGETPDAERESILRELQDDRHPLQVVCCIDVFSEGVDIPALTHVLLLRPTLSFTVFLQQLGRGLRPTIGKEYLVVLDFVGNFNHSHVARLALRGYASLGEYREASMRRAEESRRLPACCHVDADESVRRIWDEDLRRSLKLDRKQMLTHIYWEMRENLGAVSPQVLDFFGEPEAHDPYAFVKEFGSWIRSKLACGDELPPEEAALLNTPGEAFLRHLEQELSPVRSYKMVVLLVLLASDSLRTSWTTEEIARGFLDYFVAHPNHRHDYPDLDRWGAAETFSLSKVRRKLVEMPLKFLSNSADDYFILENGQDFRLKPDIAPWWELASFRALCEDRVRFALKRYFHRRSKSPVPVTATSSNPAASDEAKSPLVLIVPHQTVKGREFKTALPLVGDLAAGPLTHGFSVESLGNLDEVDWVEIPQRFRGPNRFAVRVGGKSMEPTLSLGDIVVVEYHRRPRRSGQVVIAMGAPRDGAGQGSEAIKRLIETKDAWKFKSDNADYPGFSIRKEETDHPILGVVLYNLTTGEVVK